jgi:two-component system sensor histidine kinase ChvG
MASATDCARNDVGRRGASLTLRLLLLNLLLVFLPVTGLLLLGPYETQLLVAQEGAMVSQGQALAAALAAAGEVSGESARRLLARLERRSPARLRVLDREGRLLADSSLLGPRRARRGAAGSSGERTRMRPLYVLGAWPFALWNRITGRPDLAEAEPGEYFGTAERLTGAEIDAALDGRYGATTRISPAPERSVILYSALPVRVDREVAGVILVSQSTARILAGIYEVRLAIFQVFLVSLAVAVALSVYLAGTIARPLRGLAAEARALADGRGRLRGGFRGSARRDAIGELGRALEELTRRLAARQSATEAFAADVSHQLKNPLASIRVAAEMLSGADSDPERKRLLEMVEQEAARMDGLLAGVREIVHLDAPETPEERVRVELGALATQLADSFRLRGAAPVRVRRESPGGELTVSGAPERFAVLIENLIDNAVSFTAPGGEVEVALARVGSEVRLTVADRGPGIPAEHLERVFDRFFAWRPEAGDGRHSGLGLAIVRAVAQAHGGHVSAANREGGGAVFTVVLPAA